MYSTDSYSKCWKWPPQTCDSKWWKWPPLTCDRSHVFPLIHGTSRLPAQCSNVLAQGHRSLWALCMVNRFGQAPKIGYQSPCRQTGPMHLQPAPSQVHWETSQTYCKIPCRPGHIFQGQTRPWLTGILRSGTPEKHSRAVHERKCTFPNKTTHLATCSLCLIRKADCVSSQHCSQISVGGENFVREFLVKFWKFQGLPGLLLPCSPLLRSIIP